MTDSTYRRAVSGEIVTDHGSGGAVSPDADVVDAEFETVHAGDAGNITAIESAPDGVRAAKGRNLLVRDRIPSLARRGQPGGPAFWMAGLAAVAGAFWVSGGHAVVSGMNLDFFDAASPRVRVASFVSRIEETDGRAMLTLDGELANDGERQVRVPSFSIDITTEDGAATRYYLLDEVRLIEPSGRFRFSSRLVAPTIAVDSVTITLEPERPIQGREGA